MSLLTDSAPHYYSANVQCQCEYNSVPFTEMGSKKLHLLHYMYLSNFFWVIVLVGVVVMQYIFYSY